MLTFMCTENKCLTMSNETITNIANIALALSLVVAVIFGIVQAKAVERDRRERLTLEVLRQFQTREFAEIIDYIAFSDLPENWNGLKQLPQQERIMIIQFSQQMESLGMMVAERNIN